MIMIMIIKENMEDMEDMVRNGAHPHKNCSRVQNGRNQNTVFEENRNDSSCVRGGLYIYIGYCI